MSERKKRSQNTETTVPRVVLKELLEGSLRDDEASTRDVAPSWQPHLASGADLLFGAEGRDVETDMVTLDVELTDDFLSDAGVFGMPRGTDADEEDGIDIDVGPILNVEALAQDPDFWAVAHADNNGRVLQLSGHMEADLICDVATQASVEFANAVATVGLGHLHAWCVVEETQTWFTRSVDDGLVVAIGGPKRTPMETLRKLITLSSRS